MYGYQFDGVVVSMCMVANLAWLPVLHIFAGLMYFCQLGNVVVSLVYGCQFGDMVVSLVYGCQCHCGVCGCSLVCGCQFDVFASLVMWLEARCVGANLVCLPVLYVIAGLVCFR